MAAVALVAAMVATQVVRSELADSPDTLDVEGASTDTPVILVPGSLPAGLELVDAEPPYPMHGAGESSYPPSDPPSWQQMWVRFDAAGEVPEAVVWVTWDVTDPCAAPTTTQPSTGQPCSPLGMPFELGAEVPLRGGTGYVGDEGTGPYGNADRWVAFVDEEGRGVHVSGPLEIDGLVAVAESLERTDDGGYTVTAPPPSFEQVAQWISTGVTEAETPRSLSWSDDAGRILRLRSQDGAEVPPERRLSDPSTRWIRLRAGRAALGGEFRDTSWQPELGVNNASPEQTMLWREGATTFTLDATGFTDEEIVAIAEGLVVVDIDEWETYAAPALDG